MATHRLGIVMHGITGRMGLNQHLIRSIVAIMKQGGVQLSNGDKVMPDPILLGRNLEKVKAIAEEHGIERYTDDYEIINSSQDSLFFDAGSTEMRPGLVKKAMDAGKDIYCEKPIGLSLDEVVDVCNRAREKSVKTGVVQDKLFLPGLIKLKKLVDEDFFGDILSMKIDFGYWVFVGDETPAQRPGWNYVKDQGGGIIFDMMCHWQYVLEHLLGDTKALSCLGANHIQKRWNEKDEEYNADADDACYAIVQMEKAVVAQINSSWCTRVNREDLVTFQIDGTKGSAISGLTACKIQSLKDTPRPVWNPDEPQTIKFFEQWEEYEADAKYDNGFKRQWEMFIKHLFEGSEWKFTFEKGAKGVQFAEAGMKSWKDRKWVDVNPIQFAKNVVH
ncbi:Gfo/Idh/MocA family oxidoreductase [Crocinitomix catalasitica]|nr:Gfo/Idh/MocA family oxidoreductase [Crocinitomix catalasitica]